MDWQKIIPVIVSIFIIIFIAVVRAYSKTFAAIVSTMPINIALSMWIIYSAEEGKQDSFVAFMQSMLQGIIPTVIFVFVAWLTARAGWELWQVLLISYAVWAVALGLIFWLVK